MGRVSRFVMPLCAALCLCGAAFAQEQLGLETANDAAGALGQAQAAGEAARRRAEALEAKAAGIQADAERSAQQGAALAARIQQSEAAIAANEASAKLIEHQRIALRQQLAQRQAPLIELTAALQRLSRRPPLFSLLRPGSLKRAVYLRAVLDTMLPEVQRRTAGLRAELERGRILQAQALSAATALRASQSEISHRRQTLSALETRQRIASRSASGIADREQDRALALAEQARDLSSLVDQLGKTGAARDALAALPGPVLRPASPQAAQVAPELEPAAQTAPAPAHYLLPVAGKLVAGFGDATPGHIRSRGIALAPPSGAQAVAPAAGRVQFAGAYQGYGNIVIIEHGGGWVSLVTGLAELNVQVAQNLVGGAPLGTAAAGRPVVTLELRRNGDPVNPLEYLHD